MRVLAINQIANNQNQNIMQVLAINQIAIITKTKISR